MENLNMSIEELEALPMIEQVGILHKMAKRDFENALAESGKSRAIFIMMDKDAAQMLYEWSEFQKLVKKEHDIDVPAIAEGVTVSVND